MTPQQFNPEAPLSFLSALALTIRDIEKAQPEPGFTEVFMDLLDKKLEATITGDANSDLDTRESVQVIRRTLGQLLTIQDGIAAEGGDE